MITRCPITWTTDKPITPIPDVDEGFIDLMDLNKDPSILKGKVNIKVPDYPPP